MRSNLAFASIIALKSQTEFGRVSPNVLFIYNLNYQLPKFTYKHGCTDAYPKLKKSLSARNWEYLFVWDWAGGVKRLYLSGRLRKKCNAGLISLV